MTTVTIWKAIVFIGFALAVCLTWFSKNKGGDGGS